MAERYLCVSIDTECDKGRGWKVEKPLSFVGVSDGVRARLHPLFKAYKAKATYLLSPEIIRDEQSLEVFKKIENDVELGTHLHGELAEPGAFVPDVTAVFQRNYEKEEERAKLTTLTDSFHAAFGTKATSFRAGRFGIGENSIEILESLGYVIESSVTPFVEWSGSGAPGLDFRGAPTQPYHPDPRNPVKMGTSSMWEVPVTIRPRAISKLPVLGKFIERIAEPVWLRPTHGTGDGLVELAKAECKDAEMRAPGRPVILSAMFHNVEIVPGKSPYAKDENGARAILSRLETLLRFCEKENIRVVGLTDVAEILAK